MFTDTVLNTNKPPPLGSQISEWFLFLSENFLCIHLIYSVQCLSFQAIRNEANWNLSKDHEIKQLFFKKKPLIFQKVLNLRYPVDNVHPVSDTEVLQDIMQLSLITSENW